MGALRYPRGMQPATLLTFLGGAGVAALIGLFGAWIQSRREHERWVREQRLSAYRDLVRAAEGILLYEGKTTPTPDEEAYASELLGRVGAVRLLGPETVATTLDEYMRTVLDLATTTDDRQIRDKYEAARNAFIAAARRELHIADS